MPDKLLLVAKVDNGPRRGWWCFKVMKLVATSYETLREEGERRTLFRCEKLQAFGLQWSVAVSEETTVSILILCIKCMIPDYIFVL